MDTVKRLIIGRVKITIPELQIYQSEIKVRVCDLNYGGHVGNHVFLDYCHTARMEYFKALNFSELDFSGQSLIMADSSVVYKSEVFFGDILDVNLFIGELNPYGFELIYQMINKKSLIEVARAKTGLVFFNYDKKKIQKAPKNLNLKLIKIHLP